jgi:hypothetical protein
MMKFSLSIATDKIWMRATLVVLHNQNVFPFHSKVWVCGSNFVRLMGRGWISWRQPVLPSVRSRRVDEFRIHVRDACELGICHQRWLRWSGSQNVELFLVLYKSVVSVSWNQFLEVWGSFRCPVYNCWFACFVLLWNFVSQVRHFHT